MGKIVLTDVRTYLNGGDLTGNSNKIELASEYEAKKTTNHGSGGWDEVIAGLAETTIEGSGQWESDGVSKVDDVAWSALGNGNPWTIVPTGGAVGDLAYLVNAMNGSYSAFGDGLGEVANWNANAKGTWPLVRGKLAHANGLARTSTGTGTAIQLGSVSASQKLYAAVHVLSISGTATPTITVRIESDDNSGFTSATTRVTFTAATARGGQIARLNGAITDTYWRAGWTISGTNPSFLFAVSFGIG